MNSLLNMAYFLSCFATIADSASLVRLSLTTREIPLSFSRVVLKAREDQRVDRIRVWMNEVLKIIPLFEKSNRQYQIMLNTNYSFFNCWKWVLGGAIISHRSPNGDDTLWKPSEQLSRKRKLIYWFNHAEAKSEYKRLYILKGTEDTDTFFVQWGFVI